MKAAIKEAKARGKGGAKPKAKAKAKATAKAKAASKAKVSKKHGGAVKDTAKNAGNNKKGGAARQGSDRLDDEGRALGCPTCCWSRGGCHICRRPGYRPRKPRPSNV